MLTSIVCVDASVALKLVLPEPGRDAVVARWKHWIETGTRLLSPYLFAFETASVLRNRVARGLLRGAQAEQALSELVGQGVELVHPEGLELVAFRLATELDRPTVYDTFYLAVGKFFDCATWTADERLHRAVSRRVPWLQLVRPGTGSA